MSEAVNTTAATKRKGRSPNYPGIDLNLAVQRARQLWDEEQHHSAPSDVILRHWGYAPKSGGGAVAFAALKRFGLLEDQGGGKARLTDLALRIIKAEAEGHPDRSALQEAALLPKLHQEMWAEYGSRLPSDTTLAFNLVTDRGFTPGGAADFISQWKRTMAYAELAEGGAVDAGESSAGESLFEVADDASSTAAAEPRQRGARRVLQIPLSGANRWIAIEGDFPVSELDWAQFIAVLAAMKAGLVVEASPDVGD